MADELRELIKGYLAKLEEDGSAFSLASARGILPDGANDEPFFWLKALRWCPQELLDLVNSKACRGLSSHRTLYSRARTEICFRSRHVQ
jgi:DNA mismatch repair protein MLH3